MCTRLSPCSSTQSPSPADGPGAVTQAFWGSEKPGAPGKLLCHSEEAVHSAAPARV